MGYVKQEGAGIWLPTKEKEELEGEVTHINYRRFIWSAIHSQERRW